MKKLLSAVLCCLLAFSCIAIVPVDVRAETYNNLEYDIVNNEISISGGTPDADGKIVIPDTIEGLPVTSIGGHAFENCTSLKAMTLSGSVKYIEYYAFAGCINLADITIPEGVESIEEAAFENCSNMKKIHLPASMKEIEWFAFSGCNSLESINIPDGITTVADYLFKNCSSLESITLPDSVTSIGSSTFCECSSLKNVNISDGVTSIGQIAFSKCISLKSISLPENLTELGPAAFGFCSNLESITIPDSVKNIYKKAFYNCSNLKYVEIKGQIKDIESDTFVMKDENKNFINSQLEKIYLPKSLISIKDGAFGICDNLKDIYFEGTEEEWNNIIILDNNGFLPDVKMHFNSKGIPHEKGDANGDFRINSCDLIAEKQLLTGAFKGEITPEIIKTLDLNNDSVFNIIDIVMLKKQIVNL